MQSDDREVSKSEGEESSSGITSSLDKALAEFDLKIKDIKTNIANYENDIHYLDRIQKTLIKIEELRKDIEGNKEALVYELGTLSSLIENLNPKKGGLRSAFKEIPWKKLIYLGKILLKLQIDSEKSSLLIQSIKYICSKDVENLNTMVNGFNQFCTKKRDRQVDHLKVLVYRREKIKEINREIAIVQKKIYLTGKIIAKLQNLVGILNNKSSDNNKITETKKEFLSDLKNEEFLLLIEDQELKPLLKALIDILEGEPKVEQIKAIKEQLNKYTTNLAKRQSHLATRLDNIEKLVPAYESDRKIMELIIQKLIYIDINLDNINKAINSTKPNTISIKKTVDDLDQIVADIKIYLDGFCDIEEEGILKDKGPIILLLDKLTQLIHPDNDTDIDATQLSSVKNDALGILNNLYQSAYVSSYSKELTLLQAIKEAITSINDDISPDTELLEGGRTTANISRQRGEQIEALEKMSADIRNEIDSGARTKKAVKFSGKWRNQLNALQPLLALLNGSVDLNPFLNGYTLAKIISLIKLDLAGLDIIASPENRGEILTILTAIGEAETRIKELQKREVKKKLLVDVKHLTGVSSLCNYFFDSGNIQKMISDLNQLLTIKYDLSLPMTRCAILQVLFELGESVHDLTDIKHLTLEKFPWLELVSLRNRITHQAMDTIRGIEKLNKFLLMIPDKTEQHALIEKLTQACTQDMQVLFEMLKELNLLHTKLVSNKGNLDFDKIILFHHKCEPLEFEPFILPSLSLLRLYFHEPTSSIESDELTLRIISHSELLTEESTDQTTSKTGLSVLEISKRIEVIKLIIENLNGFLNEYETNHIANLASRFCLTYMGEIFRELKINKLFLRSAPHALDSIMHALISLRGDIAHNMLVKAIQLELNTFAKYLGVGPLFDLSLLRTQLMEINETNSKTVEKDINKLYNNIDKDITGHFNILLALHSIDKEDTIAHNLVKFLKKSKPNSLLDNLRQIKLAVDCYLAHLSTETLKDDVIGDHLEQIVEFKRKWLAHYEEQIIMLDQLQHKFDELKASLSSELIDELKKYIDELNKDIESSKQRLQAELILINSSNFYDKLSTLLNKLEPHKKEEGEVFSRERIVDLMEALNAYPTAVVQLMNQFEGNIQHLSKDDKEAVKKDFASINKQIHNLVSPTNLEILLRYIDNPQTFNVEEIVPEPNERQQLLIVIHTLLGQTDNPIPELSRHFEEINAKWLELLGKKWGYVNNIKKELSVQKTLLKRDQLAIQQIEQYEKKLKEILNGIYKTVQFVINYNNTALLESFATLVDNKDKLRNLMGLINESLDEKKRTPWPKQSSGESKKSFQALRKDHKEKSIDKDDTVEQRQGKDKDDKPDPGLGGSLTPQGFNS